MKRLATLIVAVLFTTVMAFGQNTAEVDQRNTTGSGNEAEIQQSGFDGNTGNNFADIYQRSTTGGGNEATIAQIGENKGELYQSHRNSQSDGSFAKLMQIGVNKAFFVQAGFNADAEVELTQNGDNNFIAGQQRIDNGRSSGLVIITQDGDRNTARYDARNSASNNTATINQSESDDNNVFLQQSGSGNDAIIDQFGVGNNSAELAQNSGGNTAAITQDGSNNKVQGNGTSAAFGSGNSLFSEQVGWFTGSYDNLAQQRDGSVLTATQYGSFNELTLYQDNSIGSVMQTGTSNVTFLTQESSTANVMQDGIGNVANVTQGTVVQ